MSKKKDSKDKVSAQEQTLKMLQEIITRLSKIEERQEALEFSVKKLTTDVHIVHEFQKSFGERLSIVEKFCLETPLQTTRPRLVTEPIKEASGKPL